MSKIHAYGTSEEEDKGYDFSDEKEGEILNKILPTTKKAEIAKYTIPLAGGMGKLKVGAVLQNTTLSKGEDIEVSVGKVSNTLLKKATASLASTKFTVLELTPKLKFDLQVQAFKIDSKGEFSMLSASVKAKQTFQKAEELSGTPFEGIVEKIPDNMQLYIEVELAMDLSIGEARHLAKLKIKQAELEKASKTADDLKKQVDALQDQKVKSRTKYISDKIDDFKGIENPQKRAKIETKLSKEFNKTNEELRDALDDVTSVRNFSETSKKQMKPH
ncbi:MAG: hypothetical protein JW729_03230 [Bacteroidales bacterium]|nr:hypothetical protein [Bacteroidales bacterium]